MPPRPGDGAGRRTRLPRRGALSAVLGPRGAVPRRRTVLPARSARWPSAAIAGRHRGPGRAGPSARPESARATRQPRSAAARSPDVARDVLEALMLDRGRARPSIRPSSARRAAAAERARNRRRAATCATCRRSRSTRRTPATSTTRSPRGARATAAGASGSTSPTCRRTSRRGRWSIARPTGAATSVYVPGAVEPMLPEELSNHACSLVPGEDRLTVTVEMVRREGRVRARRFYRSLIRSDERLDYDRVDRIFAGAEPAREPWGEPLAAARAAARGARRQRAPRGRRWWSSPPSPSSASTAPATSSRASRRLQTESHRLIEHLMIAANEQVARAARERQYRALPRPRAPRRARGRAADRAAGVARGADAARARGHLTPAASGRRRRRRSQLVAAG